MSFRDAIAEQFDEELLFLDPPEQFDDCIVGIGYRCGDEPVVIYDAQKCIAALKKDGMSADEAVEYFEFNILGAYVGERTPVFLETPNA